MAGIIGSVIGLTYAIITKPIYKTLSFALEGEKSGGGLGSALPCKFFFDGTAVVEVEF
jgi:hypothetical protein